MASSTCMLQRKNVISKVTHADFYQIFAPLKFLILNCLNSEKFVLESSAPYVSLQIVTTPSFFPLASHKRTCHIASKHCWVCTMHVVKLTSWVEGPRPRKRELKATCQRGNILPYDDVSARLLAYSQPFLPVSYCPCGPPMSSVCIT